MDNDNQLNQEPELSFNQIANPEIISIKKRLAAPNNILPGSMVRSQTSQHILPINSDVESSPGFKMLLDQIQPQIENEEIIKLKESRLRNFIVTQGKNRSKSEVSYSRRPQNQEILNNNNKDFNINNNTLYFLNSNIKNILKYPKSIIFMSPSLFVGQSDSGYSLERKIQTKQEQERQKKQYFIRILFNNRHFPAISFDLKNLKTLEKINDLDHINQTSDQLIFNDQFQSSNLLLAFKYLQEYKKIPQTEFNLNHKQTYLLVSRLDYNTKSYGQWFYFKIKRKQALKTNKEKNNIYRFMIINMTKNSSMFGKGLKISVCRNGIWGKQGINIKYYKNCLRRQQNYQFMNEQFLQDQYFNTYGNNGECFYTLQFNLQILQGQQLYVAYNEPYTYSRLGKLLDKIIDKYEKNTQNVINLRRHRILEKTYLGNNIDVITFSAKKNHPQAIPIQQKKIIVIMGRSHPIETAGSHVTQGILNQIYRSFIENPKGASTNSILYKLLENYIIKIIPMVNPDGVIIGNSRCNLLGYDLNRCWRSTKEERCRQIYFIKNHILEYQERIEMFIDLHAHSKKKNVFAYGCHDNSNPFATRQFPYLLSKLSEKDFLFQECRFTKLSEIKANKNKKISKDGTARIYLYDILKIPNIFTIENSYCSAKDSIFHYDEYSYQIIGADIMRAISLYFLPNYKLNDMQNINQMLQYNKKVKVELKDSYNFNKQINQFSNRKQNQSDPTRNSTFDSAKQLRQNIFKSLYCNRENVSIGLIKYCAISDSQEEKRIQQITQIKKKEKNLTENHITQYKKKSNISAVNEDYHKQAENPATCKKKPSKKQGLNISSTHSQTSLAKVYKITKDRFRTLGKQTEQIIISMQNHNQKKNKQTNTFLLMPPKKMRQKIQQPKKNTVLSVVDIGTAHDLQRLNEQKEFNKMKTKQKRTLASQFVNSKLQKIMSENSHQKKEQQIKQYFRTILRKKQKFYPNKEKTQNQLKQTVKDLFHQNQKQIKPKQSQIKFKGMGIGEKQSRPIKYQEKIYKYNLNEKKYGNELKNNISRLKINNNKSLIKFNDYSLKHQNIIKGTKNSTLLINDMRLSKLVYLKRSIYNPKLYTQKDLG